MVLHGESVWESRTSPGYLSQIGLLLLGKPGSAPNDGLQGQAGARCRFVVSGSCAAHGRPYRWAPAVGWGPLSFCGLESARSTREAVPMGSSRRLGPVVVLWPRVAQPRAEVVSIGSRQAGARCRLWPRLLCERASAGCAGRVSFGRAQAVVGAVAASAPQPRPERNFVERDELAGASLEPRCAAPEAPARAALTLGGARGAESRGRTGVRGAAAGRAACSRWPAG
jgi:hypothetical protein